MTMPRHPAQTFSASAYLGLRTPLHHALAIALSLIGWVMIALTSIAAVTAVGFFLAAGAELFRLWQSLVFGAGI